MATELSTQIFFMSLLSPRNIQCFREICCKFFFISIIYKQINHAFILWVYFAIMKMNKIFDWKLFFRFKTKVSAIVCFVIRNHVHRICWAVNGMCIAYRRVESARFKLKLWSFQDRNKKRSLCTLYVHVICTCSSNRTRGVSTNLKIRMSKIWTNVRWTHTRIACKNVNLRWRYQQFSTENNKQTIILFCVHTPMCLCKLTKEKLQNQASTFAKNKNENKNEHKSKQLYSMAQNEKRLRFRCEKL